MNIDKRKLLTALQRGYISYEDVAAVVPTDPIMERSIFEIASTLEEMKREDPDRFYADPEETVSRIEITPKTRAIIVSILKRGTITQEDANALNLHTLSHPDFGETLSYAELLDTIHRLGFLHD